MRFFQTQAEKSGLDEVIALLESEMAGVAADSKEYERMVEQYVKLRSLKYETSLRGVSPDTLITVAANLLGILVIVGYEQKHVVTSKALAFIRTVLR